MEETIFSILNGVYRGPVMQDEEVLSYTKKKKDQAPWAESNYELTSELAKAIKLASQTKKHRPHLRSTLIEKIRTVWPMPQTAEIVADLILVELSVDLSVS